MMTRASGTMTIDGMGPVPVRQWSILDGEHDTAPVAATTFKAPAVTFNGIFGGDLVTMRTLDSIFTSKTAIHWGKLYGIGTVTQCGTDYEWNGWLRLPMRDKDKRRVTEEMVATAARESGTEPPCMKTEHGRVFVWLSIAFKMSVQEAIHD